MKEKKGKWSWVTFWFLDPELNWQCAKNRSDFNRSRSTALALEKRTSYWIDSMHLRTESKRIPIKE